MSNNLYIGYLADHQEALPTLEHLFESEWAAYYGPTGPGDAQQDLLAYSNHGQLPVGVVAFLGAEPCGVAALKADSIATHKHLTPWIGGAMVAPQFRRKGIGARLVAALEGVARDLGFTNLYAGTSTANSLLIREGWQLLEVVQYEGESVSIYEKAL
ncbi:MAG: GNAT family N-acetyltransferase [Cellvibrio sp.]